MDQEKQTGNASENHIIKTHQEIIAKIQRIRRLNASAIRQIENATENAVRQFSVLIKRLNAASFRATEVLNAMREKVSLHIVKDTVGKKANRDPKIIREKYGHILKDVTDQLLLTIERKSEDVGTLCRIKNKIDAIAEKSGELSDEAENDLKSLSDFVEQSANDLEEAADIESRFIHSTILLLEDVVLSMLDSFIQLNGIIEDSIGESSSLGDEIEKIIVNFQFEDISNEISRYILEILTSIIDDLQTLNTGKSGESALGCDFQRRDWEPEGVKEKRRESHTADLKIEEDVTFF
jgi:hypothetical protein